jgi:hypothetical protein
VSAACSRNLGKRRRRDSRSRRTLPASALKSIVRSKKTKSTIGNLFLIHGAPLRHIDDAPRNDLAHSTGIGGPGTLTSRPQERVPGLIEGRREYGNGFGIEGRRRPDQIRNAGHPRTPTRKAGWPAPLGSQQRLSWAAASASMIPPPSSGPSPPDETVVAGGAWAIAIRQIAPWCAGSIVHTRHASRLVRQHRPYGRLFIVREFVAHHPRLLFWGFALQFLFEGASAGEKGSVRKGSIDICGLSISPFGALQPAGVSIVLSLMNGSMKTEAQHDGVRLVAVARRACFRIFGTDRRPPLLRRVGES